MSAEDAVEPEVLVPASSAPATEGESAALSPSTFPLEVEPMDLGIEVDTEKVDQILHDRAMVSGSHVSYVTKHVDCPSCGQATLVLQSPMLICPACGYEEGCCD